MTYDDDWLTRFSPDEWIRAALGELSQARNAYARRNGRAGLAGCRRAAGVALNGLIASLAPAQRPAWGRSYMEHLSALAADPESPPAVREAARQLLETPLPGGAVVALRTPRSDEALVDAAETVMAHSLAAVLRAEVDSSLTAAEGGSPSGPREAPDD
ncbi:MAG: hypothetical protein JNK72_01950 [Myxococcales bacterium]|nr:hypothetical protein [Myxococcales bacterium]